jgi:hypothetical protein
MTGMDFKEYLATVEGLLRPDKPSVPGTTRLNGSLYPRSRLRVNPHLRPPKPNVPVLKKLPVTGTLPQTPAAAMTWTASLNLAPTPSPPGSAPQPAG